MDTPTTLQEAIEFFANPDNCLAYMDFGGKAFGVFDPTRAGASKKAWESLLAPKRVTSMNAPRYRKTDELGALLRAIVKSKYLDLDVRTQAVRR